MKPLNNVAIIIPARIGSTRLPRKPLQKILNKTIIARVIENAKKINARVIVATDSEEIKKEVEVNNAEAFMTGEFQSGTDRIAYVASKINEEIIVNLQGDEPFLTEKEIQKGVELVASGKFDIATIATKINSREDFLANNIVKVLTDENGKAIYFSRLTMPYTRIEIPENNFISKRHIGLYVYRREILLKLAQLKPHPIELSESLEQLRWIANSYQIGVAEVEWNGIGIDTPEDLIKAEEKLGRVQ